MAGAGAATLNHRRAAARGNAGYAAVLQGVRQAGAASCRSCTPADAAHNAARPFVMAAKVRP